MVNLLKNSYMLNLYKTDNFVKIVQYMNNSIYRKTH